MARWLFTLVALCLMSACGGDSSPTSVGDNSSGEAENGNDGPIFEENNTSLVVVAVETPDTLFSGSQPVMFAATVQDSNQFAGQIEVAMRLRRGDEVWTLSRQDSVSANTARFGAMFDSTLAAGFLGNQTLQFQAVDASAGGSKMLTKEIYLENEAPILFEADTPDTLERQTGDPVQVRISVSDRQGLGDIDSVYFKFRKPDGSWGGEKGEPGKPGVPGGVRYPLFDDGDPDIGEVEKGDGRFSWNFKITKEALLGTYTFMFFSRDRAGNPSNLVETGFELVPLQK